MAVTGSEDEGGGGVRVGGWGGGLRHNSSSGEQKFYLNPGKSRQAWQSWLSLHRKSATDYSQAKPSHESVAWETRPRLRLKGPEVSNPSLG